MFPLHEFVYEIEDGTSREAWAASLRNMLSTATGGQQRPRLTLARQDKEYQALVVERLTQQSRQAYLAGITVQKHSVLDRLVTLTTVLHGLIESYVAKTAVSLGAARPAVIERLCKVLVTLPLQLRMDVRHAGVAYEVFESLNAKGLDLTQADLIKNRLFSTAVGQGTTAVVEAYWTQAVEAIEGQADPWITLPEFLQFHYASAYGPVKATELFACVSELLSAQTASALMYAQSVSEQA